MGYRSDGDGYIYLKKKVKDKDFIDFCVKEEFSTYLVDSEMKKYGIGFDDWKCLRYSNKKFFKDSEGFWDCFINLAKFGDFVIEAKAEDGELFGKIFTKVDILGNYKVFVKEGHAHIVWDDNDIDVEKYMKEG